MASPRNFLIALVVLGTIILIGFFVYNNYFFDDNYVSGNHSIFIRIYDNETQKQISTGYQLFLLGQIEPYAEGQSLSNSRTKITLPENASFYLLNNNLEGQNYYISSWRDEPYKLIEDRDIELKLHPYGDYDISHSGQLGSNINVSLNTNGLVRLNTVCIRWSINLINVETGLTEKEIPSRLVNKVDKCFEINENNFIISHEEFSTLNSEDYILLYVIDEDLLMNGNPKLAAENREGEDIALSDKTYEIK